MIIIADTTPLNYLTLIGEERILPELFGRVVVPQAVFNELQDEGTPEAVRLLVGSSPQWLEVRTVTAADALPFGGW
jgi:predicted nucleic acid-binding protein